MVEDRRFPVNTIYLSAYSPVFERMFQIDMKEKDESEVEIKDVKSEHFEDFLAAISPHRIHPNRLFSFLNQVSLQPHLFFPFHYVRLFVYIPFYLFVYLMIT